MILFSQTSLTLTISPLIPPLIPHSVFTLSFYKTVCGIGYIFARVTGALSPPGGEFLPEREVETLLAGPQSIFLLNSWMGLLISLSLSLSFFYFSTLCLHQHWYILTDQKESGKDDVEHIF